MLISPPARPIHDIHFFQDPTYIRLLTGTNWEAESLSFRRDGRTVGSAILMRRKLRIYPAKISMVMFGPKCDYSKPEDVNYVFEELRKIAIEKKHLYVAVQPYLFDAVNLRSEIASLDFNVHPGFILFHHTVLVDLTPLADQIFSSFRDTLQRTLRKSEKMGVEVRINEGSGAVDHFYDLYQSAHQRSGGGYQRRKFFEDAWEYLARNNEVLFAIAYLNGKPAAGVVTVLAAGNMIYLAGGSANDDELLQARPSERLHWELIQIAKQWGCKQYDLGGVTPNAIAGSKKAGIAQFKTKFASSITPLAGYYRYDCKPTVTKAIDLVIPWARAVKERFFSSEESEYNLM